MWRENCLIFFHLFYVFRYHIQFYHPLWEVSTVSLSIWLSGLPFSPMKIMCQKAPLGLHMSHLPQSTELWLWLSNGGPNHISINTGAIQVGSAVDPLQEWPQLKLSCPNLHISQRLTFCNQLLMGPDAPSWLLRAILRGHPSHTVPKLDWVLHCQYIMPRLNPCHRCSLLFPPLPQDLSWGLHWPYKFWCLFFHLSHCLSILCSPSAVLPPLLPWEWHTLFALPILTCLRLWYPSHTPTQPMSSLGPHIVLSSFWWWSQNLWLLLRERKALALFTHILSPSLFLNLSEGYECTDLIDKVPEGDNSWNYGPSGIYRLGRPKYMRPLKRNSLSLRRCFKDGILNSTTGYFTNLHSQPWSSNNGQRLSLPQARSKGLFRGSGPEGPGRRILSPVALPWTWPLCGALFSFLHTQVMGWAGESSVPFIMGGQTKWKPTSLAPSSEFLHWLWHG